MNLGSWCEPKSNIERKLRCAASYMILSFRYCDVRNRIGEMGSKEGCKNAIFLPRCLYMSIQDIFPDSRFIPRLERISSRIRYIESCSKRNNIFSMNSTATGMSSVDVVTACACCESSLSSRHVRHISTISVN